jgi:hypothetical protein
MQSLIVTLPKDTEIPVETLASFSPHDNLVMLLVGIEAVKTMKLNIIRDCEISEDFYQTELFKKENEKNTLKNVYDILMSEERSRNAVNFLEFKEKETQKIANEFKDIIQKKDYETSIYQEKIENLNECILLSKDMNKELQMELAIKVEKDILRDLHFDNEINIKMKDKLDTMNKEIFRLQEDIHNNKFLDNEKLITLNAELIFTKDKLSELIINQEKEKNILLNLSLEKSILDNSKIVINKSNSRGASGEKFLWDTASNAFKDFAQFDIQDKSKTPHCGDMWLIVNSITIMCDSKNYKDTFVPKSEIEKLKSDISVNKTIKIAWLVSMDKPILKYSNAPFVIDIIDNTVFCFINSLMLCLEPEKLLVNAYYQCKFVYDNLIIIQNLNEDNLLEKYQKNDARTRNICKKMLDSSKDRAAIIDTIKAQFSNTESAFRDILNHEVKQVEENNINILKSWWEENMVKSENKKIGTNDLHKKFLASEENKNHGIDNDMFKHLLKDILDEKEIIHGLTNKSQLTLLGYDYKNDIGSDKKRKIANI